MNPLSAPDLARYLDQALFAPAASQADLERVCAEARQHSFYSVCVNGSRVEQTYSLLDDSGVQVTALVGFPLGAADADAKRYEAEIAVDLGAHEIDYVLNLGQLKDGRHRQVLREMRDIVEAAEERVVKVILETHLLLREEIIIACELALDSGAQFVCTSTDFHAPDVSADEVKLLRATLGDKFGIKAAGNIRDAATALALIAAGATRIGANNGVAIIGGLSA